MRFSFLVLSLSLSLAGCATSPNFGDDASTDDAGDEAATTDDAQAIDASDAGTKKDAAVIDSGDGFGAARTACLNEINALRATQSHAALALWTGSAIDTCVDEQATNDEKDKSPHEAWINQLYPTCNGNGQDECEGYGVTPQGIKACLDAMWAEKDQPNCAGCPACSGAYNPNCPNCDFYGQTGPECGHYVNMSADYFNKVACGFSTLGGWAVQNFSP